MRATPGRLALRVFRIPLWIYHRHPQWLPDNTFVRFVHIGRRTGQTHEAVALVLNSDDATDEVVVCAAWGAETDWVRNLRRQPATLVQLGSESFVPQQRFLSDDEAHDVAVAFRAAHPVRWQAVDRLLGWHVRKSDEALRNFLRTHPFVAFGRPTRGNPTR